MIPLSVPNISGNEWKYIKDCLDTNWVSSVGSYVTRFENTVAEYCGVKYAIATSNGTAALHISLLLAGVQQGDLVILPDITFVAPANAIKYIGAQPVLVDVEADTWQMNLDLVEEFLSAETEIKDRACVHKRTGQRIGAVLPVHVLGNMCDMDELVRIASKYHIAIVEDATEALGSFYKEKHAGGFGVFGCLSFNGNKVITTGGGGMILSNNEVLAQKAKHLTTQAKARGDEYYHDEVGFNYRLVNILAAMGVAQMERLPFFLQRKREIAVAYNSIFDEISCGLPQRISDDVKTNHWLYTVRVPKQKELRDFLTEHGVEVRPFWVPMNRLPAFEHDIYVTERDVSNEIYNSCVSLPCSTNLTPDDQQKVIKLIKSFYRV